jgi:hypothetical protein
VFVLRHHYNGTYNLNLILLILPRFSSLTVQCLQCGHWSSRQGIPTTVFPSLYGPQQCQHLQVSIDTLPTVPLNVDSDSDTIAFDDPIPISREPCVLVYILRLPLGP